MTNGGRTFRMTLNWTRLRGWTQKHLVTDVCHWFVPPGFDDRDTDLFLCDTNTCKFDGECLRIGNMVTCICDFKVRPVTFLFCCLYVCSCSLNPLQRSSSRRFVWLFCCLTAGLPTGFPFMCKWCAFSCSGLGKKGPLKGPDWATRALSALTGEAAICMAS